MGNFLYMLQCKFSQLHNLCIEIIANFVQILILITTMRRIILFVILGMFVTTSCINRNNNLSSRSNIALEKKRPEAPKRKGWHEDIPLYGNINSIEITKSKLKDSFGKVVKDGVENRKIYKFNQRGDVVEGTSFNSDGTIEWKGMYRYDSQGNQIEARAQYYDGGILVVSNSIYKYDSQGHKIEESWYNDSSLKWKKIYKYNSRGNRIEEASYNSDGSLERKDVYKYDSIGHQIEWARYYGGGLLASKSIYKYNLRGNMIEVASYKSDGSLYCREIYKHKYDSRGNITENTTHCGSLCFKHLYSYDASGNRIEESSYDGYGSLNWKKKYNSYGNVIELMKFDSGTLKWKNIIKYDSLGNKIEQARYSDGILGIKDIYKYDAYGNQVAEVRYFGEIMCPEYLVENKIVYCESIDTE